GSLVARPAEVRRRRAGRCDHAVDLLPGVPADVADPQFVGTRTLGDAERVAQPVPDNAARVGVGGGEERVARHTGTGGRIDPQYRAVEGGRTVGTPDALAAQRTALGPGRAQRGADRSGRIATRVGLVPGVVRAVLSIVDVVEARAVAVAAADVQVPVAPEQQRADRVAGE